MTGSFLLILSITGLYFLIILGTVLFIRFRKTGSILPGLDEFFLASRDLSPVVMAGTFVGTVFSAFFAIGFPGLIYTHGIAGVGFIILADVMGVFFVMTYYKSLRAYALEHKLYSPIECLSKAYNNKWLGLTAAAIMIFFICPYIAIQLVGIGKFIEGLSDGEIGYIASVGSMVVIIAIYLIFGGMRAVAYTDIVQALAIFLGIFCGTAFMIYTGWGSLSAFFEDALARAPEYLSLPGPKGVHTFNLFFSMSLFSVALFFMPQLLMRGIMAKSDRHLDIMGLGFLIAVMLAVIPGILVGIGGFLQHGAEMESNQIVGVVFSSIMEAGWIGAFFTGLLLIGLFGASMSTADSFLLSVGQLFTRDVIQPFREVSEQRQVLFSRIIMVVVLTGAFLIGLNPPELMANLAVYSIAGATVLVPTYLGFQWKKRSSAAAITSMILGIATLAVLAITKTKLFGLHEGFIALMVAMALYIGLSYAFSFSQRKIPQTTA